MDVVDATVKVTTRLDQVFLVYVDRHIHSVNLQRVLGIVGPLIVFLLDGMLQSRIFKTGLLWADMIEKILDQELPGYLFNAGENKVLVEQGTATSLFQDSP